MKDLVRIWNSWNIGGRQYSNNEELHESPINRLKKVDIETSNFDSNLSECEGLNEEVAFNDRKEEIIDRLFERRKKGQLGRQPKCLFMQLMFGFIALAAGCLLFFFHPYDIFFAMKVRLEEGGEIFEIWRKPEVDVYCRIFLFNITNAKEYMAGIDSKIKVQEVGPYVYKENLEHDVTGFNENGTLNAIPKHPLTWVEELSEGHKEDDMLYLPHIALLSIANVVSPQGFVSRLGLNHLISITRSQPLEKMTAKEFMMGYKSQLMTLGNTFLPGWIYFDKLGLIDRMYDFNGDYETIFTGATDPKLSGLIDTYKGSTDLPQWEGKHCSNIQNASDGSKFKGGAQENETLLFFRKSLCRAAPMVPKGVGKKGKLNGVMYGYPEHMLDNGKYIEENKCYCRKGKCLPEGLIDVTDCYYGFPIALSYPHFYKGDDVLFGKVEGLAPNKDLHETRFWIEAQSGLPLDVSSKFQINMALGDISSITNVEKFANTYLPLLWFDIRMFSLPQSMEQKFYLYLVVAPIVEEVGMYLLFASGTCLVIFAVYRLTFKVMFKSFDGKKKRNNCVFGNDIWTDREKNRNEKDNIYTPCEVPLTDKDLDYEKRGFKSPSDRIRELSHRLSDKVYDSVGSVKDIVRDLTHVKNIFNNEKRASLVNRDESIANDAFKSDSSDNEEYNGTYKAIKQSDSDDDCKYLEVVDDGSDFDDKESSFDIVRSEQDLGSSKEKELIIQISD